VASSSQRVQSPHGVDAPPSFGELAVRPPLLGSSFKLLGGRDHHAVYFRGMPYDNTQPGTQLRHHGDPHLSPTPTRTLTLTLRWRESRSHEDGFQKMTK
jgi:hypothetical protein